MIGGKSAPPPPSSTPGGMPPEPTSPGRLNLLLHGLCSVVAEPCHGRTAARRFAFPGRCMLKLLDAQVGPVANAGECVDQAFHGDEALSAAGADDRRAARDDRGTGALQSIVRQE